MAWKRHSDEDALKILREIDVHLHDGLDVVSACRRAECRHSLRFVPRSALRTQPPFSGLSSRSALFCSRRRRETLRSGTRRALWL